MSADAEVNKSTVYSWPFYQTNIYDDKVTQAFIEKTFKLNTIFFQILTFKTFNISFTVLYTKV